MAASYVIKAAKGEQFVFNLRAGNNEVILTSELYTQKSGALNGTESVRKNAADDARFERKKSKNDEPFFVLKAGNGEVIGKSEMYSSTSAMEKGIASVKKNGPVAVLKDLTEPRPKPAPLPKAPAKS